MKQHMLGFHTMNIPFPLQYSKSSILISLYQKGQRIREVFIYHSLFTYSNFWLLDPLDFLYEIISIVWTFFFQVLYIHLFLDYVYRRSYLLLLLFLFFASSDLIDLFFWLLYFIIEFGWFVSLIIYLSISLSIVIESRSFCRIDFMLLILNRIASIWRIAVHSRSTW